VANARAYVAGDRSDALIGSVAGVGNRRKGEGAERNRPQQEEGRDGREVGLEIERRGRRRRNTETWVVDSGFADSHPEFDPTVPGLVELKRRFD
jgi:hypothetical protein